MNTKMTPKRLYYSLAGALILLSLLALGGAFVGSSLLNRQNEKLTQLKLDRRVLEEQKRSLDQAKKDIERYAELEKIAKQIVPQEKDQVRTVREIVKFASEAGVAIGSITFPGSTLGDGSGDVNLSQLEPVEGLSDVYRLEITLRSPNNGPTTFGQLVAFLQKLESNRRTSQVSSITITPNADNRNLLDFTITLNVYIKP